MISKSKNNNPFLFCKFLVGVYKYKMYTHTPFYRCHIYNQPINIQKLQYDKWETCGVLSLFF